MTSLHPIHFSSLSNAELKQVSNKLNDQGIVFLTKDADPTHDYGVKQTYTINERVGPDQVVVRQWDLSNTHHARPSHHVQALDMATLAANYSLLNPVVVGPDGHSTH